MKISKLSPGQIVYDCHSQRMGNTTMRTLGVWRVRIESIADDGLSVIASWNHNAPRKYYAGEVAKWTAKEPELVRTAMGQYRRKTRDEKKAGSVPNASQTS